jgi:VanZ family protein
MGVIFIFSAQPDQVLNFGQTTLVSKLAHVAEYGILGGLIQWARGAQARHAWRPWLAATVYAATDEFHQLFVPGRTARVTDVMIDAAGAAAGIAIALWRR